MPNYNYWLNDWPKIVVNAFSHRGRMFEIRETKDARGISHYEIVRELNLREAMANARPNRRAMTMTIYNQNATLDQR
jgi:hypothetical protein